MPDVSRGAFNNIERDKLNYGGDICNRVRDGSHYFPQSVHFTAMKQNGPCTDSFRSIHMSYSGDSLTEVRQDKLEQILALARHLPIATSALFS